MYAASDGDLKESLLLADARYYEVHAQKAARRRANRDDVRKAMATNHSAEEIS